MASAPSGSLTTPAMVLERTPRGLRARLCASLEGIDAADTAVMDYLSETGAVVDVFAFRILLREALLNAVMHGSGCDAGREVRLAVECDDTGVVLDVEDDGPGFDWQNRNVNLDILGDGGRGLALMHHFAAEVTFNECGNRVRLRRLYAAARQAQGKANGNATD
jgi:serine/threonine-protein kinase RsbW